ncbi:MAG: sugar ABC transporter permease [Lachnospiraceae bacterium]|nr:sugar ABC transporter permease [Lachnospiraceae bacterium]
MKEQNKMTLAKQRSRDTNRVATIFLIPVCVLLIIYMLYPIVDTFITSLFQWNGISADKLFIGIENWKELIVDKDFWEAFLHNCVLMVFSIIIQLPISIALATFLNFLGKRGGIFKVIWFIPMLMSSVAVGFLFQYILATNGGVISMISNLFGGGNIDLLGSNKFALFAVLGVVSWQSIPFYMVYFLASYSGISTDVFEAAKIDGATRGQYFWRIALPLLKPSISKAVILSLVGSLKYFDLIFVMTQGGPGNSTELMATYMYKNSFVNFNMGYGSTVAGGMFILITIISLVTMKATSGKED